MTYKKCRELATPNCPHCKGYGYVDQYNATGHWRYAWICTCVIPKTSNKIS